MRIFSFVLGFIPVLAARSTTVNVPKPTSCTDSLRETAPLTASKIAAKTRSITAFDVSLPKILWASDTKSDLFIYSHLSVRVATNCYATSAHPRCYVAIVNRKKVLHAQKLLAVSQNLKTSTNGIGNFSGDDL
jgi:hypothetical protein